jgi:hypothetical protein
VYLHKEKEKSTAKAHRTKGSRRTKDTSNADSFFCALVVKDQKIGIKPDGKFPLERASDWEIASRSRYRGACPAEAHSRYGIFRGLRCVTRMRKHARHLACSLATPCTFTAKSRYLFKFTHLPMTGNNRLLLLQCVLAVKFLYVYPDHVQGRKKASPLYRSMPVLALMPRS